MNPLQKLINTLDDVKEKFDLDLTDLKLIEAAQVRWDAARDIRVTDFARFVEIASPATIHYRVSRDLVSKKIFELKPNPQDAREKLVVKGTRYNTLIKFLEK